MAEREEREDIDELVEIYYKKVEWELRDAGLWDEVIKKFPPKTLREAVKKIIERCVETKWDPESVDWRAAFATITDYGSVEAFINGLTSKFMIPPPPELERMYAYGISELERIQHELKKKIVSEEEYALIEKAKMYEEQLRDLRAKVKRLEKYIEELERERVSKEKEFARKIEEIKKKHEEEMKRKVVVKIVTVRFKVDCEQFTGADGKVYGPFKAGEIAGIPEPDAARLIEAGAAETWVAAPPRRLTAEDVKRLEQEFKGYLARVIGFVPEKALKEFEREISTLRETPTPYETALKAILDLARSLAEKYAPPAPVARPPVVERAPPAPPPEEERLVPPRVAPPGAPIELMSFPRRLASSEIKAFWEVFRKRLEGMGLDPYEYMDYWVAFRDAWYSNWLSVLRAFEDMIEDIRRGKPVRFYPKIPPWKNAADAVLHLLATKVYTNLAQLVEALNAHGYPLEPEAVKEIVKKEWEKKPRSTWLLITPREYLIRVLGLTEEDLPP